MKHSDWVKTLIISVSIAMAGYFIGDLQKTGKKYDRMVQVKGLSEREVSSDLAVWPMNIVLPGNDLKTLKKEMETQISEVYNFFIAQGFDQTELTKGIATINDSRANIYNSDAQRNEYRYLANSEFTVRTKDIKKLQKALIESLELISKDIVLSSKNSWRPIEYIYTGLNDIKPSMIEEATKNAREVAEKFAEDSNSTIGEIRVARQGLFSIEDRDQNTPEIKIVRVVSTIDYQLKD